MCDADFNFVACPPSLVAGACVSAAVGGLKGESWCRSVRLHSILRDVTSADEVSFLDASLNYRMTFRLRPISDLTLLKWREEGQLSHRQSAEVAKVLQVSGFPVVCYRWLTSLEVLYTTSVSTKFLYIIYSVHMCDLTILQFYTAIYGVHAGPWRIIKSSQINLF